jgi:hypothetical protein
MAYGTKYRSEFKDDQAHDWKIDILKDGYSDSVTDLKPASDPLTIEWDGMGTEKYQPIRGSAATIRCVSSTANQFVVIFDSDDREYQVKIYLDEVLYWQGWLLTDQYLEDYCSDVYEVELFAVDGLKNLSYVDFANDDGTRLISSTMVNQLQVVTTCLNKLDYEISLYDYVNIFEESMNSGTGYTPLDQAYNWYEAFYNESDDTPWNCYDVLCEILRIYGATLTQANGYWHIYRPNAMMVSHVRRLFVYYMELLTYDSEASYNPVIALDSDLYVTNADMTLSLRPAINKAEVELDMRNRVNMLMDGDFITEKWTDATHPKYWYQSDIGNVATRNTGDYIKLESWDETGILDHEYISDTFYALSPSRVKFTIRYKLNWGESNVRYEVKLKIGSQYLLNDGTWTAVDTAFALDETSPGAYVTVKEVIVEADIENGIGAFGHENTFTIYQAIRESGWSGDPADVWLEVYGVIVEFIYDDNKYNLYNKDTFTYEEANTGDYKFKFDPVKIYLGDCEEGTLDDNLDANWGNLQLTGETNTANWSLPDGSEGMIQELLAKQILTGYASSVFVLTGSLYDTDMEFSMLKSFYDPNFYAESGYYHFLPCGMRLSARECQWYGEYLQVKNDLGEELITSWSNNSFDTFSSTGTLIQSAISNAGNENAMTSSFALTVGEKIHICLDIESMTTTGSYARLIMIGAPYTSYAQINLSEGLNLLDFTITVTQSYRVYLYSISAGEFTNVDITVKKITGY